MIDLLPWNLTVGICPFCSHVPHQQELLPSVPMIFSDFSRISPLQPPSDIISINWKFEPLTSKEGDVFASVSPVLANRSNAPNICHSDILDHICDGIFDTVVKPGRIRLRE